MVDVSVEHVQEWVKLNPALTAQAEAIEITADCPYRRIFHSDQGWSYQMKFYTKRLKNERIFQSMSQKGNCHDNAVMENSFHYPPATEKGGCDFFTLPFSVKSIFVCKIPLGTQNLMQKPYFAAG